MGMCIGGVLHGGSLGGLKWRKRPHAWMHAHGEAPPCRRKHGNGITTAARSAAGNHSDAGDAGEVPAGVIRQDPARGDGWAEQEHAWQAERRSAVLST
ncbi:Hypothetical protein EPM1_1765 [Stenotrophomonas maltophilia EPM1]|nr:Hypothetical protein EPM1_1765 [Stenotrophomonas maltophilia EPM1]